MTCFVSLRTQYENLGDEVINALMLKEFCARSRVVALGQGVPDWYIANVREILGPLSPQMQVISSEMQFMMSVAHSGFGVERSLMFTSCGNVSGERSDYRRASMLGALQYLPRLRLGMVGASYSSVSRSKAGLLRIAAARSKTFAVRDKRSQAVLAANGISVPVEPDLAFLLPIDRVRTQTAKKYLAIFQLREVPQIPFQATVDLIKSLATQAGSAGLTPCIAWQVHRDSVLGERLAQATGLPIVTPENLSQGRLSAFNALYDEAAIIFSNRLHGLLVAAARGAVAVPLLHDGETKVRGVFEGAGLADLILSSDSVEILPQLPDAMWLTVTRERAKKVFAESAESLRRFFDEILGPPLASLASSRHND